ncbi:MULTISPECIES: DUF1206 domain-containing protein [unclassified Microcella]|uniref:DUF1206 domain-containing protein n=1 Tax=unclassified Microcella TaxID=2630066 RepID=UPI000700271C|nr:MULTISPECIES: DUF1206 domain-containing protein [unclassified Microcella]KQV25081.1 hypothetical protein ASC54_11515 [Yonghaparkia sp. Root332]KRF31366.1 hypothetical protein ASG83_11320 [Yonghaparkia sp. Soil809]
MRARAVREVRGSRPFQLAARAGFATNGLLHVLMGFLALGVATGAGTGGRDADPSGALTAIAATPGGIILIWVLAAGLVALALWLLVEGLLLLIPTGEIGDGLITALKGVVYAALAASAVTIAMGGRSDSTEDARELSAVLIATPGGVFVLALLGLVIVGIGVYFVVKGLRRRFRRDLRVPSGTTGRTVVALGVIGYVAKGVALVSLGILAVVAAVTTDPSEVTGLDGALRALTELPFGVILLSLVGLGLVAYGVYCAARARWARL